MNWQLSHTLLGFLYSLVVAYALKFLNTQFALDIPLWFICLFGFIVASTYFYAREAGQLEHDFKNGGNHYFTAWAKAQFGIWPGTNWLQAAVAFGGAAVAAILAYNV